MRALVLFIPIAAFAVFFGVNQYTSASADINGQPMIEETANAQDTQPAGPNMVIAWFKEKFGGQNSSDDSAVDKGFGFKYGECNRVGQAKRCRTKI